MAVFASRQIVMPVVQTPITVTITRSGNASYCYATINGTKQYEVGTYGVYAGDTITFGVYGKNSSTYGYVKIDGTEVLRVKDDSVQTYDWTVPGEISAIEIDMLYLEFGPTRAASITVTTA